MIGHQQIVDARKKGTRPRAVFLEIGRKAVWPENQMRSGELPTVCIEPEEMGLQHDFRFLAGIHVHMICEELTDAVLAVADEVVRLSSDAVLSVVGGDSTLMHWKNGEWQVYA